MNKNDELIYELKQSLKEEILSEMTVYDAEVLNHHSRLYKFVCWAWWSHLYRDGVCLRCGKVKQSKN